MSRCRNGGLRKRCGCPRRNWAKCPHGWHLNYKPKGGPHYRLSLDREAGRPVRNKTEAIGLAESIRTAIREKRFRPVLPITTDNPSMTFRQFADAWRATRGTGIVSAPIDVYRLSTICKFALPNTVPPLLLGDKRVDAVNRADIEAFRAARKAAGLSAVSVNHDLRLLRKMFNWGVRTGHLVLTPFKRGSEPVIALEREIPRNKRLHDADTEKRLLDSASPHLRAVIVAMLDTACRPGELLSLQWRDVSFERRELTIRAEKEKTRRERIIPISSRLLALLEMRRLDPAGQEHPLDAYVFGDRIGRRVKSVNGAWKSARDKARLGDFQLRDLRHEAASRFDEAGVAIVYVSTLLGHSNISTTSRYLNVNRRGLHLAMQKLEASRSDRAAVQSGTPSNPRAPAVAQPLHKSDEPSLAVVQAPPASISPQTTVQ
jgi:integrase